MSDCTHDCHSCGGGCEFEVSEGGKKKDVLEELKKFVRECDNDEADAMFKKMAADLDKEIGE